MHPSLNFLTGKPGNPQRTVQDIVGVDNQSDHHWMSILPSFRTKQIISLLVTAEVEVGRSVAFTSCCSHLHGQRSGCKEADLAEYQRHVPVLVKEAYRKT